MHSLAQKQHERLEENHQNLQQERLIGGQIQEVLLVGKVPENIPGVLIAAHTNPSREIDGDFFDFYRPIPEVLDIVIGDVMGKGLPAALVGTAVKTQISRFAIPSSQLQSYDKEKGWDYDILPPKEILHRVHRETADSLFELEYFVTLIYGRFDWTKRTFSFIDCGATKPLHYQKSSQKVHLITGVNIPLGITLEDVYQEIEVPFHDKDLFIFYSDGVTEARSSETGQLFGVERLIHLVEKNADKKPQELYQILKDAIIEYTKKTSFDDDLTLMIIQIDDISKMLRQPEITLKKFTSNLTELKNVRDFVSQFCRQVPGDASRFTNQLQLAINEAFCNIVKHGYKENPLEVVIIGGEMTNEGVWFDIADQGSSFDPSLIQNPSLLGDQDRGLGFYMIKQVADRLTYSPKAFP